MAVQLRKKVQATRVKKNRRSFKELPITKIIPNIITLAALCAGLTAIRYALSAQWEISVICILVAALLDGTDGRVARLLNSTSNFGAELDSLADFVNFGVVPSVVVYLASLQKWSNTGWGICLFFIMCSVLRLARFNTALKNKTPPSWTADYSTGVPAPAGAILGLAPLILFFKFGYDSIHSPTFCAVALLLSGSLMISRIPTFVFKTIKIPTQWIRYVLAIIAIAVIAILTDLWGFMSLFIMIYIILIPYSAFVYRKKMAQENGSADSVCKFN